MTEKKSYIGFTCSYTPLALIDAVGYVPYRILPMGNSPDQAGHLLHENLCPHVKRVLDRAIDDDLPELASVVILNSCDAMRRLADAWQEARPNDRVIFIDLPISASDPDVAYFESELRRLADTLSQWGGRPASQEAIAESIGKYNQAALLFESLQRRVREGTLNGGAARLQELYNKAVTQPINETQKMLQSVIQNHSNTKVNNGHVPLFLFGNVLPDLEAFELFESCGIRIVDEDLCTGSRVFAPIEIDGEQSVLLQLARGLLTGPRCPRTVLPTQPVAIAQQVLERATACQARGVIACSAKFCDPYISRLADVREILQKAGLPMLHIEGDCTMRSFGQQRTRIEAFAEMLTR